MCGKSGNFTRGGKWYVPTTSKVMVSVAVYVSSSIALVARQVKVCVPSMAGTISNVGLSGTVLLNMPTHLMYGSGFPAALQIMVSPG